MAYCAASEQIMRGDEFLKFGREMLSKKKRRCR